MIWLHFPEIYSGLFFKWSTDFLKQLALMFEFQNAFSVFLVIKTVPWLFVFSGHYFFKNIILFCHANISHILFLSALTLSYLWGFFLFLCLFCIFFSVHTQEDFLKSRLKLTGLPTQRQQPAPAGGGGENPNCSSGKLSTLKPFICLFLSHPQAHFLWG